MNNRVRRICRKTRGNIAGLVGIALLLLSFAACASAAERVTVAAANLSIELIDGMMEVEGQEDGGALLMEPERNFVLRVEERGRSYEDTLKFVREAYISGAGLSIAEDEETKIGGKTARIFVSQPDGAEPQTCQSILVLGDEGNSLFAYVAYPAADKDAAADVKKMFLSIRWPVKR